MSDEKWVERITAHLDASTEQLDGATRSRLTQARHRALESRRQQRWLWPAVGGAVAASLVVVMVWRGQPVAEQESLAALDFELLNEGESFELMQEVEFLQWLEEVEQSDVV